MKKRKRILVIFAGGTIASSFRLKNRTTSPDNRAFASLHSEIEKFFTGKKVELFFQEPLGIPGKDSSNLGPEHWIKFTSLIAQELKNELDGVLILYGTDTMAYLSAWLSICFPEVPFPIIITGSQLTLDYTPDDVIVNLRGAAQVVYSGLPGVWIYCNWKLIPGMRAHKAHALHPDVFTTINGAPVYFNPDWVFKKKFSNFSLKVKYNLLPEIEAMFKYKKDKIIDICKKVDWIMCLPGMGQELKKDKKILCIFGFGAGNAPSEILDYIRSFYSSGEKPGIIACSQAEGDIKKPKHYQGVGIGWLVKDGFKVWNQMDYPLEFIHALACFSLLVSYNNPDYILSKYLESII
ncbi:MAG: asparaginase [Candidatus Caldatribacteriota bacterium]